MIERLVQKKYYALISSLPSLVFENDPPIEIDDFYEACRAALLPKDWEDVSSASIEVDREAYEAAENEVVRRWIAFEIGLRNELVRLRSIVLGWPEHKWLQVDHVTDSAYVLEAAQAALDAESPREAEIGLLQLRWDYLESLRGAHQFDVVAVLVYSLHLQLLHLKKTIDDTEGSERFEAIYAQIRRDNLSLDELYA